MQTDISLKRTGVLVVLDISIAMTKVLFKEESSAFYNTVKVLTKIEYKNCIYFIGATGNARTPIDQDRFKLYVLYVSGVKH